MKVTSAIIASIFAAAAIAYIMAYGSPSSQPGQSGGQAADSRGGNKSAPVNRGTEGAAVKRPAPAARRLVKLRDDLADNRYDIILSISLSESGSPPEPIELLFDRSLPDAPHHALRINAAPPAGEKKSKSICRMALLVRKEPAAVTIAEGNVEIPADANSLEIILKRRGAKMAVFSGGRLIAYAVSRLPAGGAVELLVPAGMKKLPEFSIKPVPVIDLYDGFIRMPSETGDWEVVRGEPEQFQTKHVRNTLEGVNAFSMMGCGNGTITVLKPSDWRYWDDYTATVHLHGPEKSKIGLIVNYRAPNNYTLFRWTARVFSEKGELKEKGMRELVLVRDGKETVLAGEPGGYQPNTWYQIEMTAEWGHIELSVDGHRLLSADDPRLSGGGVGFWCDVSAPEARGELLYTREVNDLHDLMITNAVFDDLTIRSMQGFREHFNGASGDSPGGWRGSVKASARLDGQGHVALEKNSEWLWGPQGIAGYKFTARVLSLAPGSSIAFSPFYRGDNAAGLELSIESGGVAVLKTRGGPDMPAVYQRVEMKDFRPDAPFTLGISTDEGHVAVSRDGNLVIDAWLPQKLFGPVKISVTGGKVVLDELYCDSVRIAPPAIMKSTVFAAETKYMDDWQSIESEWREQGQFEVGDDVVKPFWHRMLFPGNVNLEAAVRSIQRERDHELVVSICKNGTKGNGYTFSAHADLVKEKDADAGHNPEPAGERPDATTGGDKEAAPAIEDAGKPQRYKIEMVLKRNTEKVFESKATIDGPLRTVGIRRAGRFVIGSVNGKVSAVFKDSKPLKGSKVAFFSRGLDVALEKTTVHSNCMIDNFFNEAPWDWRPSWFAIATVANRWQCDPRWTFMTLRSKSYELVNGLEAPHEQRVAVLWSKRLLAGDQMVDIYVGPKMNQRRDQRYKYARDFNISICADGKTISSGYTFRLMGYGNRIQRNGVWTFPSSQLLRGDKVVGVSEGHVGRGIHREWFNIRMERRNITVKKTVDGDEREIPAAEIRVWVNDRENGTNMVGIKYIDENPLNGNHIAVWTYDMGLVLPRIRIAGDGADKLEDPDLVPAWDMGSPVKE